MTQRTRKNTKRSTDEIITDAIDRQQSWLARRRMMTRAFLRRLNFFRRSKTDNKPQTKKKAAEPTNNESVLRAYWFPITCALIVILVAILVICFKINAPVKVIVPNVPDPVIKPVDTNKNDGVKQIASTPTFDLVRIEKSGHVVIAGRNPVETNISIVVNKKVIATEHTNKNGEFVYSSSKAWNPGNYAIYLIDTNKNIKSKDTVFVYVSEKSYKNSLSLLMTQDGSKIMQSPNLQDGDLKVSTIDYMESTGRLVVSGRALPRLRVSLTLNGKYLGFARVSDYKNFGLGADVKLTPGKKYTIIVRLHDASGTTIAKKEHKFVLPEINDDEDIFYTVRRGDTLWAIARNFLRRGTLYSLIADCNDIENPDLIYPKQLLQIPVMDE